MPPTHSPKRWPLLTEAAPFVRFCIIGVVNTGIHFALLTLLVEGLVWQKWPANVCGFLAANAFSYYANSRWNFGVRLCPGRYAKFLVTSVIGVIIAAGVMLAAECLDIHYRLAFAFQVALMPVVNFTLLRVFVFSDKKGGTKEKEKSGKDVPD